MSMLGRASPAEAAGTPSLSSQQRRLLAKMADEASIGAAEFPASSAQRRVWFVDQMAPRGAYAMPIALRLHGPLELEALRRAFQELVARHEALRTTFPARDGTPVQLVHREGGVPLTVMDRGCDGQIPFDAIRQEARRPFDLAQQPLARATVWRLNPDDHVLLMVTHYIVADGWSVEILLRDLAAPAEAAER